VSVEGSGRAKVVVELDVLIVGINGVVLPDRIYSAGS